MNHFLSAERGCAGFIMDKDFIKPLLKVLMNISLAKMLIFCTNIAKLPASSSLNKIRKSHPKKPPTNNPRLSAQFDLPDHIRRVNIKVSPIEILYETNLLA